MSYSISDCYMLFAMFMELTISQSLTHVIGARWVLDSSCTRWYYFKIPFYFYFIFLFLFFFFAFVFDFALLHFVVCFVFCCCWYFGIRIKILQPLIKQDLLFSFKLIKELKQITLDCIAEVFFFFGLVFYLFINFFYNNIFILKIGNISTATPIFIVINRLPKYQKKQPVFEID